MKIACLNDAFKIVDHFPSAFPQWRVRGLALSIAASAALLSGTAAVAQSDPSGISSDVAQQMQAISNEKLQRTDAQKKIAPALLYAARIASGQPQFPNSPQLKIPQLSAPAAADASGQVVVDIKTNAAGVAELVQSLGGSVVSSIPQFNAVRARLPLTALETLAASPAVRTIGPAEEPQTNRIDPPPGFGKRSANVRARLADALQTNAGTGTTKSEAIIAHGADIVQNAGKTGAGVRVCVISNGISTLAARQSAGEIGPVQILSTGQGSTSGDEGTAMLELVADMAPGATLGWSTGNGGPAQFAQNILDLRNTLNCGIIVDDLSYYSEAAYQEDIIANAVTTVVNNGAMYFSSAANSGHLTNGQSGTWEGDFVDGGAGTGIFAGNGNPHNFGSALYDTLTANTQYISLKWSDPVGGSGNDYDLYVTNSTGSTIIGASNVVQNGSQDPFELAQCGDASCPVNSSGNKVFPVNARIYILKYAGSTSALRLDTNRGRLSIATSGSTYGHNAGVNTISVAASPTPNRKFNSSDVIESYSSDGFRRLFLNPTPATTAITPGCVLFACGGGTTLSKPDITAGDCDTTTTPGFIPFCGTSAAAPNSAAIAALIKSASPSLTGPQILARMKATAIDIMAAGVDRDSGSGIVMADAAVSGIVSSAKAHDFNGDGKSDILWRNGGGANVIWQMNSATPTVLSIPGVDTSWQPVGQRDFDGDGKTDILWRNSGGSNAIWFMNGNTVTSVSLINGVDTSWYVAGTADVNGDGKGDIIWRNGGGTVAVWLMNNSTVTSVAVLGTVSTDWTIYSTADFNGDGKGDLLWRNTAGNNAIWLMNGTSAPTVAVIGGVAPNWTPVGTGDFNGDGKGDILWRNSAGSNAVWLMSGTTVASVTGIAGVGTTWNVASSGDYNGDGKADILWRENGGTNAIWFMSGATVSSVSVIGGVATNWSVQNAGAN